MMLTFELFYGANQGFIRKVGEGEFRVSAGISRGILLYQIFDFISSPKNEHY